jgi:hypothetical protein
MLTQLSTVKARLGLPTGDLQFDDLLTRAIGATSARFDRECNRCFARAAGAVQEFGAMETEILASRYPIETVTKFELKTDETEGWVEQQGVRWMLRGGCVISLGGSLSAVAQSLWGGPQVGRVTYTGGYVLPGGVVGAGQSALPADVESAAVEQVAVWFQQRDKLGLTHYWPKDGVYLAFIQAPLLPQVSAMLRPHRRWAV